MQQFKLSTAPFRWVFSFGALRVGLWRVLLLGLVFVQIACGGGSTQANGATVVTPVASEQPVVFNAPTSVRPGDIVGLQGENFGDGSSVTLEGSGSQAPTTLPLVNKFGTGWLSFKVPDNASGALVVRVNRGAATSAAIKLNAARPHHLDALQLVPGGAFRLFGRNLLLPGFAPVVTVDGLRAAVDMAASDEHMLTLTAPTALRATAKAVISVDNGNGTGSSVLDRPIEVVVGSGDPFGLGVGWGAGFSGISSKPARTVACSGVADDTPAVQSAMDSLASSGGGVLQLPSGTCRFARSLTLKSRVVLQGSGKDRTLIAYEANYPLRGIGVDLVGVRNLAMRNVSGRIESPLLQDSSRVFFQNVRFDLAGGTLMFLTNNKNFVVTGSEFNQPKNPDENGPYTFDGSSGLYFAGNTTTFANGAPTFSRAHDTFFSGNRFTRDARDNQESKGVIHSFAMDFAHRIAVVGNTFDVLGGPITNKFRNDGETLLTEGGGARRTENVGTVVAASARTLSDPGNQINVMPFQAGTIPENYGVAIVGGKGAGQSRRVTSYAGGTLTMDAAWDVIPDATSRYATFVWGLEKSLIKGNVLNQNPRGIWLYQTALREVDIVGNNISEGGGIYLRSAQNIGSRLFVPMYGVRIADNRITNTSSQWRSYISVLFVRMDEQDFGIGTIGVEVRGNLLQTNSPNLFMPQEEAGGIEGFVNRMNTEGPTQALSKDQTRLLGTIFQNNQCLNCEQGIVVRDGAKGTVQEGNLVKASMR
jgi:hypothetical protein